MTDCRIDVFQNNLNNKYRQIELQGSPENITRAAEKIYKIVDKYYFFDNSNPRVERRDDASSPLDRHRRMRKYKSDERNEDQNRGNIKRARVRLGNRNDRNKIINKESLNKYRQADEIQKTEGGICMLK